MTPRPRDVEHLQVLPELRPEQAARLADDQRIQGVYFDEKWDLGNAPVPANASRVTRSHLLLLLLKRHFRVVELPEPLWLRELPYTLTFAVAVKVRSVLTRQRSELVFYGIENNDLSALVGTGWRGSIARPILQFAVRWMLTCLVDRIVFGSPSARELYLTIAPGIGDKCREVLELPSPSLLAPWPKRQWDCAFVGELSERKGVVHLMKAWEAVEARFPTAAFVLVGDGPLGAHVRSWCQERPQSRQSLGLVDSRDVRNVMASVSIVVAPSVRWGRWREQIGLPIKEALSVGATVVTTDETGLAPWLREAGHTVMPVEQLEDRLADAIEVVLVNPLPRDKVLRSLPGRDSRLHAHRLLHQSRS